jgi:hypothetical protein
MLWWIVFGVCVAVSAFGVIMCQRERNGLNRPGATKATFIAVVVLEATLSSCGNDWGPFGFSLRNDLHNTAVVESCLNTKCTNVNNPATLAPGQIAPDVGVPDQLLRAEKVYSHSGRVLGCLPFRFLTTPPSKVTVDLSRMAPCGESGGSHGNDWPSTKY